jgi:8-amino-7-oxononanoate synthase
MHSLDAFASEKLDRLERENLRRVIVPSVREEGIWVRRGGRRLLSFSCNDYLNLTQHPRVKAAAIAAIEQYGTGAGASRLVTGDHPLYAVLEERLARLKGSDAACVFGSGYLANAGIVPALVGKDDAVLIDALAHSCLWAGALLSGAAVLSFRHNDLGHLEDLLAAERGRFRHVLLATDHVFSMDGDRAPLDALAALAGRFDAWLMADDAHGLGVVAGAKAPVPLQMGTLSKAVGGYGGYLCASRPVIDLVKTRARTLVYSTGLPPATVAAAIAALAIIEESPALVAQPLANARLFTARLGLAPAESAIVPILLGAPETALAASGTLAEEGFLVTAIRPPTVPDGTARLRLAFTAGHPEEEILRLADAIERLRAEERWTTEAVRQ